MLRHKSNLEIKLTILGLIITLFLGLLVFFLFTDLTLSPLILMYLVFIVVVFIAVLAVLYANSNKNKSKRKFEDVNIYRFMDKMLDDLSPEELNYLEQLVDRTLQERELIHQ